MYLVNLVLRTSISCTCPQENMKLVVTYKFNDCSSAIKYTCAFDILSSIKLVSPRNLLLRSWLNENIAQE